MGCSRTGQWNRKIWLITSPPSAFFSPSWNWQGLFLQGRVSRNTDCGSTAWMKSSCGATSCATLNKQPSACKPELGIHVQTQKWGWGDTVLFWEKVLGTRSTAEMPWQTEKCLVSAGRTLLGWPSPANAGQPPLVRWTTQAVPVLLLPTGVVCHSSICSAGVKPGGDKAGGTPPHVTTWNRFLTPILDPVQID